MRTKLKKKRTGIYYINHVKNLRKFKNSSKVVKECYLELYRLMDEL